ncbi:MAG: indole-3-glycerol-phosphate synthase [Elusimicrobia bacterium]|nr:indole-3-glycerol-phosphate synthase [Elusimicrobiota bacterium]
MAADVLASIAAHTDKRVARLKTERPIGALKSSPLYKREPRDFARAFDGTFPRVIAEIKFASPSAGFLRQEEPAPEAAARIAGSYLAHGAAALSVLTERHFFAGAPEFLSAVRAARPDAFLLMKDFFIDPYQFELARAHGADCVLLIAALLKTGLKAMLGAAQGLGLSALVEVHDEGELEAAKGAGARLIGVNSRDLRTLKTDLDVARRLAGKAPGAVMIAESGLKSRAELSELSGLGYKGFLVGTALMRVEDPGLALSQLISA